MSAPVQIANQASLFDLVSTCTEEGAGLSVADYDSIIEKIEKAKSKAKRREREEAAERRRLGQERRAREEREQGIAPFSSLKAALEVLRFEMKSEEWDDDAPCWSVFEKWHLTKSGTWKNPYAYYAIGDEIVFFAKRRYDAKEHRWRASDKTYGGDFTGRLNVRTPFKTGDIVTFDCRPFAPLRHGLILMPERDGVTDCCFPRALVRLDVHSAEQHEDPWCELSVKHGGGLHISMPGYSVLYRMEVWDGDLPEDERVLLEVQKWLDGDREKGEALAEALSKSEVSTKDLCNLIQAL